MSVADRVYTPTKMCELCFPIGNEIGEVAPGCWLIENEGKYVIMVGDGHKGQEAFEFPDKPTPDPDPDNLHEEGPILEESCRWVDKVLDWSDSMKFRPTLGYCLCDAAEKAGWERGDVLMWFYNRAGQLIEEKSCKS